MVVVGGGRVKKGDRRRQCTLAERGTELGGKLQCKHQLYPYNAIRGTHHVGVSHQAGPMFSNYPFLPRARLVRSRPCSQPHHHHHHYHHYYHSSIYYLSFILSLSFTLRVLSRYTIFVQFPILTELRKNRLRS